MIGVGSAVRRTKRGQRGVHGRGMEAADDVGEEGTVTRVFSWKWMKVEINNEAWWVRTDDFEEV